MLKELLMKEPILKYPDPEKPYVLLTDASKNAWACVLTQSYLSEIEGKLRMYLHPITFMSGLFRGSQMNWATLTKEAYTIYMSIKKLTYYLEETDFTIRSDHLPIKKFIEKNTLNTKVNNWAVEISPFKPKFEYIKGIKNTLVDTMSRLIKITPGIELEPEPPGMEYGYHLFEALEPIKTKQIRKTSKEEINEMLAAHKPLEDDEIKTDLTNKQIIDIQRKEKFCKGVINNLLSGKLPTGTPYYLEDSILKRYVTDNKQRFETIVLTKACALLLLRLAHDEMGHNGSARTYMLLRKLYFWKEMKPQIFQHVKQCKTCQQYNITLVKYDAGHFEVPKSPMEFISMDLVGEFSKSERGNTYALTVICMLTGYTFCIPLQTKTASEVVQAYVDNVYCKYGGSRKILSDNGTEFKNKLFSKVATELGVEYKCYSPPYHPQSNGRIEGFHHFLKACMAKHMRGNKEWDEIVPLACAAYNFFPNEHSKESPLFLMFGRDPRIPINKFLTPKIRYLGDDENILSLGSLKQIYHLVAQNLKLAREKMNKSKETYPIKLKKHDLVMIKNHARKQFQPLYKGYFRIISFKGNQVEVMPQNGGPSHYMHISDVKYVMLADSIIQHLPNFNELGRKTKYNLNPDHIIDLNWCLATTLNTNPVSTLSYTLTSLKPKTTTIYSSVINTIK